jgi:hypothetical protein
MKIGGVPAPEKNSSGSKPITYRQSVVTLVRDVLLRVSVKVVVHDVSASAPAAFKM